MTPSRKVSVHFICGIRSADDCLILVRSRAVDRVIFPVAGHRGELRDRRAALQRVVRWL